MHDSEPLWRELVGAALRRARHSLSLTLGDVSRRSGVSPQYLSEVERGLKEPSSEMLAAIAGALELTLLDLTVSVSQVLMFSHGLAAHTERASHTEPAAPSAAGQVSLALAA